MARSDLLIKLVKAGLASDKTLFRKTVEAVVAEERAKQHNVVADRLEQTLEVNEHSPRLFRGEPSLNGASEFLIEVHPRLELPELILAPQVLKEVDELVEEHHRSDLLRTHGLEPRHRVLLIGPPGNGKTSLAEAIASAVMAPMFVLRYDGVIGSFLGETASRLRKVFDFIRTRPCVLFFDEFDTIGKERGDIHETGEIKRVVSSLLLQMDALPSHVIVVTATNHAELLDRAVWRRFQIRLQLESPGEKEIATQLEGLERRLQFSFEQKPASLAKKLVGGSYAEIEQFALDIARQRVLQFPEADLRKIVKRRLEAWRNREATKRNEVENGPTSADRAPQTSED